MGRRDIWIGFRIRREAEKEAEKNRKKTLICFYGFLLHELENQLKNTPPKFRVAYLRCYIGGYGAPGFYALRTHL